MRLDLDDPDFQRDPWPVYARLRAEDRVHWSERHRCWFVTGYDEVWAGMTRPELIVGYPFRASRQVLGPTILDVDGADHQRMRRVVAKSFRQANTPVWTASIIEPVVAEVLADLDGRAEVDLVADLAMHVPPRVIARVLGVPAGDAHWFYRTLEPIIAYIDHPRASLERALGARDELDGYFRELARTVTDDDSSVLGLVLRAHRVDGVMSEDEVFQAMVMLLAAGTETTIAAIANALHCLLAHGVADRAADPSYLAAAVQESLRWEPPLHMTFRMTAAPIELGGRSLPRGAGVQLVLASANRDEARFPAAATWDPSRPSVERDSVHFGGGRHQCLGGPLAVAEIEVAVARLLGAYAIEPTAALPPIRGRVFRRPAALPVRLTAKEQSR
jgi:cytochrome P450